MISIFLIYLISAFVIAATCKRSLHKLLVRFSDDLSRDKKYRHPELIVVCMLIGYRRLSYLIRRIENNYLLKDISINKGMAVSSGSEILYNREFWPEHIAFVTEHLELNGPLNWILSAASINKNMLVVHTHDKIEFHESIQRIYSAIGVKKIL
jgi:hypothetical protein